MTVEDVMKNENIPTHYKERYKDAKVWRDFADVVLHEFSIREYFRDRTVLYYNEEEKGYVLPTNVIALAFVGLDKTGLSRTTPVRHFTVKDGIIEVSHEDRNLTVFWDKDGVMKRKCLVVDYYPVRKCLPEEFLEKEQNEPPLLKNMCVPILPVMETAFISGIIWACGRREDAEPNLIAKYRNDFEKDMLQLQYSIKTPRAKQAQISKAVFENPFF